GFPTKNCAQIISSYGCDFVNVSHKLSRYTTASKRYPTEWRFSFSVAEVIIVCQWTWEKRVVYRMLRLIGKMIKQKNNDSVLCTYYFKTLMLWACEQKLAEFWLSTDRCDIVEELLLVMIQCLINRHCPNYFIPENNMMDHLVDIDVSCDVDLLCIM